MSDTECPRCGQTYTRISQHWRSCGYPSLPPQQRAILCGLLLSGATVSGNGQHRHLTKGTTNNILARWVERRLGWMCHSIRSETYDGERDTVHRLRTPAHPALDEFETWPKAPHQSGRLPRTRISPTPRQHVSGGRLPAASSFNVRIVRVGQPPFPRIETGGQKQSQICSRGLD